MSVYATILDVVAAFPAGDLEKRPSAQLSDGRGTLDFYNGLIDGVQYTFFELGVKPAVCDVIAPDALQSALATTFGPRCSHLMRFCKDAVVCINHLEGETNPSIFLAVAAPADPDVDPLVWAQGVYIRFCDGFVASFVKQLRKRLGSDEAYRPVAEAIVGAIKLDSPEGTEVILPDPKVTYPGRPRGTFPSRSQQQQKQRGGPRVPPPVSASKPAPKPAPKPKSTPKSKPFAKNAPPPPRPPTLYELEDRVKLCEDTLKKEAAVVKVLAGAREAPKKALDELEQLCIKLQPRDYAIASASDFDLYNAARVAFKAAEKPFLSSEKELDGARQRLNKANGLLNEAKAALKAKADVENAEAKARLDEAWKDVMAFREANGSS